MGTGRLPLMNKYRNVRTNGYASRREANRAAELRLLSNAKIISELEEQPRFELVPKQDGESAVSYYADFSYLDEKGNRHIEDVKGIRTPVYILKQKLLLWRYGIKIEEV